MEEDSLSQRLSKYPQLKKRMEQMLDVIENGSGEIELADTAEACLIQEGRHLNQEALQCWANEQSAKKASRFEQRHHTVQKAGKKNSAGTVRSGRLQSKSKDIA